MESDWDHVTVLRKKAPTAKEIRNESTLNAARRAGAVIASEKKCKLSFFSSHDFFLFSLLVAAGHNKTGHSTDLNVARLDRETDELEHKRVPAEVGRAIIKARTEKGWNQKELAVVCFQHLYHTP